MTCVNQTNITEASLWEALRDGDGARMGLSRRFDANLNEEWQLSAALTI